MDIKEILFVAFLKCRLQFCELQKGEVFDKDEVGGGLG